MLSTIETIYTPDFTMLCECPVPIDTISAGYPSDGYGHIEEYLDLNEHLIKNPVSTFFLRVAGTSMIDAGIFPGDILIVDKSLDEVDKNVVIAIVNEEFTVKRYRNINGNVYLVDEKDGTALQYRNFEIWGVVTSSIHAL